MATLTQRRVHTKQTFDLSPYGRTIHGWCPGFNSCHHLPRTYSMLTVSIIPERHNGHSDCSRYKRSNRLLTAYTNNIMHYSKLKIIELFGDDSVTKLRRIMHDNNDLCKF